MTNVPNMTASATGVDAAPSFLDTTRADFSLLGPEFQAAREASWYAWAPTGLVVTRYDEANA
jgi:hypothetical protein